MPHPAPLKTETALITGASSGFGEAIAEKLARLGARVVLCARREARLMALAEHLRAEGCQVHTVALDVQDRKAVEAAIAALPTPFHEPTILVNNAGLALGLEPAWKADVEQWEQMVATNINGLMYLTRAVLPGMVARKKGHVFNIGSIAGTYPYPGGNAYGGTKAFVHQFSLNLRADVAGTGVRVTCIEPGLAETEFSLVRFGGDAEKAKGVYQGTQPLTGADVAEAVAWCASLPPHVNINVLEMMPTCQAFGPLAVSKE